jgi:hypothetical protein
MDTDRISNVATGTTKILKIRDARSEIQTGQLYYSPLDEGLWDRIKEVKLSYNTDLKKEMKDFRAQLMKPIFRLHRLLVLQLCYRVIILYVILFYLFLWRIYLRRTDFVHVTFVGYNLKISHRRHVHVGSSGQCVCGVCTSSPHTHWPPEHTKPRYHPRNTHRCKKQKQKNRKQERKTPRNICYIILNYPKIILYIKLF